MVVGTTEHNALSYKPFVIRKLCKSFFPSRKRFTETIDEHFTDKFTRGFLAICIGRERDMFFHTLFCVLCFVFRIWGNICSIL